jgi:hypothetical protein
MFFRKDPPQTEGRRNADQLIKTSPVITVSSWKRLNSRISHRMPIELTHFLMLYHAHRIDRHEHAVPCQPRSHAARTAQIRTRRSALRLTSQTPANACRTPGATHADRHNAPRRRASRACSVRCSLAPAASRADPQRAAGGRGRVGCAVAQHGRAGVAIVAEGGAGRGSVRRRLLIEPLKLEEPAPQHAIAAWSAHARYAVTVRLRRAACDDDGGRVQPVRHCAASVTAA